MTGVLSPVRPRMDYVSEIWALVDKDGRVAKSRGGSSTRQKIMTYESKQAAERAANNKWTRQARGAKLRPKKIYEAEPFNPDWSSAPGDTIVDLMRQKNICVLEAATMLGWERPLFASVLAGEAVITGAMADSLAEHLGATPVFWLTRDMHYQKARSEGGA